MTPSSNILINSAASDKSHHWQARLTQLGNILYIPSGLLVMLSWLLHPSPPFTPQLIASPFWIIIHAGFLLSLLLGIFGLFASLAIYLNRQNCRLLGIFSNCLAVVGMFLIGGLDYSEVFIFPTLANEFPSVIDKYGAGDTMPSVAFAFPAAGLFTVIGFFFLSYELCRTQCISKGAGMLTMIGTVIFGLGLSGFAPNIVTQVGATVFGLGLIWLGISSIKSQNSHNQI